MSDERDEVGGETGERTSSERATREGGGLLSVVATPIGNLSDLSPRALETLRESDAIVAEDTRHTRGLLTHFDVHRPLLSLPAFDEEGRIGPLVERLKRGERLALVTDAGTPGISDPGNALVAAAWEAGVWVVPIPGPSAVATALSVSGFPAGRFHFAGFLPRKGEARREVIAEVAAQRVPTVLFEAGNRVGATLRDLAERCGPRVAVVARELTKRHEELARAPLPELAQRFPEDVRGEVVIVVSGATEETATRQAGELDDALRRALASGERLSEAARTVAAALALPRQEVYARALALRDELASE